MPVKVRIPSPLRSYTNGVDVVEADGGTVAAVLSGVIAKAAGMEPRLFKAPGQLNRFVNVYVNDEDIRFLQNLDTPVKAGDEVSIVPAIAGGAGVVAPAGVRVRLPSLMRSRAGGRDHLIVIGTTVGAVLDNVASEAVTLRPLVFRGPAGLNRSLNVFVNDEDIRHLSGLETPVTAADEVSIVTAVAGG